MELTRNSNISAKLYSNAVWVMLSIILALVIGFFILQQPVKYGIAIAVPFCILLVLHKPLIGLIASMPLVLYFSYVDLLWVSPWNYLVTLLGGLAVAVYYNRRRPASLYTGNGKGLSPYTHKVYVVSFLFLILMTVINFILTGELRLSAQFIPLLFIAFCTMVFVCNEKDLKLIIYSLTAFMSISAFVGIMQFAGIDFFWQIREVLGTDDPVIALQIHERLRVPGLAFYNIQFSYQLSCTVPLVFAILLSKTKKTRLDFLYLLLTFSICFLASIISKSKSLVIAVIAGVVWGVLKSSISKKSKNAFVFLFFAILVLVTFYCLHCEVYEESDSSLIKINSGNLARIPLFWAGIRVFLENPWGVGAGNFNIHAEKFYPQLRNMPGVDHLLVTATHNQFLNILVYYGFLGLFLLVLFYYLIIKGIFLVTKYPSDSFVRAVAIGLLGSIFAYLIQSMFHNAGHFTIDPFAWYFVGISLFLFNYCRFSETHIKS